MSWLSEKLRSRFRARALWPTDRGSGAPSAYYEFDTDFHERYERAMKATGTARDRPLRRLRFFAIERVARQVCNIPGNACEVGCFRGLSAYLAADTFERVGKKLTFHLCDSFEGLSEPTASDQPQGTDPEVNIRANQYSCSEADVRQHLSRFDCFSYHKGWIPEPFRPLENERFCYAHIDVDLYEPTLASLEFLWPRLNPRGVMVLDDYGTMHFPGARRAIESFFAGRTDVFLMEQPAGTGIAVKISA